MDANATLSDPKVQRKNALFQKGGKVKLRRTIHRGEFSRFEAGKEVYIVKGYKLGKGFVPVTDGFKLAVTTADNLEPIGLSESDYRGDHQPGGPGVGAPLWDLTSNGVYPKDVYSREISFEAALDFNAQSDSAADSVLPAPDGLPPVD